MGKNKVKTVRKMLEKYTNIKREDNGNIATCDVDDVLTDLARIINHKKTKT